ncbi:OLC1v1016816C1 [Oldenlandia corymbosa var. corymbosa]|uniref:OLC1v1016816C1 n=1 Tax=Oldenlandia corymbosa var. corymbosa TaxID=529605 RepID=A0AAV1E801_OLDCO|nr:OLC1v1016816C1 [Oldenlandia corymbosa var. corymbosa]
MENALEKTTPEAMPRRPGRPKGSKNKTQKPKKSPNIGIPTQPLPMPRAKPCEHRDAHKFYKETADFCCGGGEISLAQSEMPKDLVKLFTGTDEASVQFRKEVRTYNNNLAFTSLGAQYDRELTKNTNSVYTFKVMEQVYHLIHNLQPGEGKTPKGLQLYFFDSEEELKARLSQSPKRMIEETLSLLMDILKNNPYREFLKDLKDMPTLDNKVIVPNMSPKLDQRRYNLPKTNEVAAIFTDMSNEWVDKSVHIQIYDKSEQRYALKHYSGCYDTCFSLSERQVRI